MTNTANDDRLDDLEARVDAIERLCRLGAYAPAMRAETPSAPRRPRAET